LIIFDDSKHCAYDIIIGRNIIQQFGFIINFAKIETSCLSVTLPFLQRNMKPSTEPITVQNFINDTIRAKTSTNLTHDQNQQLTSILSKILRLFNNDIGKSTHQAKLQLIDPHATPIHSKPFSIPNNYRLHFKKLSRTWSTIMSFVEFFPQDGLFLPFSFRRKTVPFASLAIFVALTNYSLTLLIRYLVYRSTIFQLSTVHRNSTISILTLHLANNA